MEKTNFEEFGNVFNPSQAQGVNGHYFQEGNGLSEASRPYFPPGAFHPIMAIPHQQIGGSQYCSPAGNFHYSSSAPMQYLPSVCCISPSQRAFLALSPSLTRNNPDTGDVAMATIDSNPSHDQVFEVQVKKEHVETPPPLIHVRSATSLVTGETGRGYQGPATMLSAKRIRPQCTICSKTFASKGTLKVHMRIHNQEKPFRCEQCSKAFAQSGNLTTHVRIHTGEKPFQCPFCGKRFIQSSAQRSHLMTHVKRQFLN